MTETRGIKTASSDAREAILSSIRESLKTSAPFDADWREHHGHASDGVPAWVPVRTAMSAAELTDIFCTNLGSLGGHCTSVADENEAAERVGKVIEKLGA